MKPFEPVAGKTVKVTTSTTASAAAELPSDCEQAVITNADSTDTVFWRATPTASASIAVANIDLPILPGGQIRVTIPRSASFSVVASANTPIVYITPGKGN